MFVCGPSVADIDPKEMGVSGDDGHGNIWTHYMYEYNPDVVHNENSNSWEKIPDRRVEYVSEKYPWLVAAYRYHNKVNMHFEVL